MNEVGLYINFAVIDFFLLFILFYVKDIEKKSNQKVSKLYPNTEPKKAPQPKDELETISQYGEKWKLIEDEGVEPRYYVSNFGRVYNKKYHRLVPFGENHSGVTVQLLKKDGKYTVRTVHLLVARYFIGEQNRANYHVNHLDNNIKNNFVGNLAWEKTEKPGRRAA